MNPYNNNNVIVMNRFKLILTSVKCFYSLIMDIKLDWIFLIRMRSSRGRYLWHIELLSDELKWKKYNWTKKHRKIPKWTEKSKFFADDVCGCRLSCWSDFSISKTRHGWFWFFLSSYFILTFEICELLLSGWLRDKMENHCLFING